MNIIKELGSSRLYNLHSHTEFCDGRAQMEAFAREVIRQGFSHYGFSPHSTIPIESPCNITSGHVADYDCEFRRISETYGDRCRFFRSMEIDYLGPQWGPAHEYFARLNLDYAIGSVHFIPDQSGRYVDIDGKFESFKMKMERFFNNDIRYVVEKFYEQSISMVSEGGFDILGHLDKIAHNASLFLPGIEDEHWYAALVDDLISKVIESGVIVEINTKIVETAGRYFPDPRYWGRLVAAGVPLVVNSDAHVPALINAGRCLAFDKLDEIRSNLSL